MNQKSFKDTAARMATIVGFGSKHAVMSFDGRHGAIEGSLIDIASHSIPSSIVLSGDIGTGKTGLLCCMLKHHFTRFGEKLENPEKFLFFYTSRVYLVTHKVIRDMVLDKFNDGSPVEFTMTELQSCSLLIIDDLGDCGDSDYVLTDISDLLDYRWKQGLITWISTNISKRDWFNRPGWGKIASRIFDREWSRQFEVTGMDRRDNG